MSDKTKYILSGVFIVIGLSILAYNHLFFRAEITTITNVEAQKEIGEINIPLYLHDILFIETSSKNQTIQPLILLEPTACLSCLNNLSDYRELLQERPGFNDIVLLFMNHEKNTIERFMLTTNLSLSYAIVDSARIPLSLRTGTVQNLLFWNTENERVFYNEPIPNVTTSLESKKNLITLVDSLWNYQKIGLDFNRNNNETEMSN